VLLISILLTIISYLSITFLSSYTLYFVLIILLIIGIVYSFHELNKRMNIRQVIIFYINKFKKNKIQL